MKRINYKGFDIWVEIVGNSFNILEVRASITNQIALLTECLCRYNNDIVKQFTIELGCKWFTTDYECIDFAIDIDKWLLINPSMKQKVLIELLMLEENEIMEQLQGLA